MAEIEAALGACEVSLRGIAGNVEVEAPLRAGVCGAPAPVVVSGLGNSPEVRLVPAPRVTCPVVAALARWLDKEVQPAARASFGSPVVKLETMSAYECRNRVGDTVVKLSEHAAANAVDVGAFVTADGKRIEVLSDWGAKVKARRMVANAAPLAAMQPEAGNAQTTDARPAADPAHEQSPEELFLHGVHRAACSMFGTVLGPEANEAHSNHLHLDLAARRRQSYCR